jgi:hypothetical protein
MWIDSFNTITRALYSFYITLNVKLSCNSYLKKALEKQVHLVLPISIIFNVLMTDLYEFG